MSRRNFLRASALTGAGAAAGVLGISSASAQQNEPIRIIMTGYGPPTTSFSLALKRIGDRVEAKFPGEVAFQYVYNILELGYKGSDILWLVENGIVSMGYQSSSYLTDRISDLGAVDLPFIFGDNAAARRSMDGDLGELLTQSIEADTNYRILGYFENGERHFSNSVRPIRTPKDMEGLSVRSLPSKIHERTFEMLGAEPEIMDLSEVIKRVVAGTIDAQENPFANTVTYGVHNYHKYHTASSHFYISRPIFFHRPTFDSWPSELQQEMQAAVTEAIDFQRNLKDQEELDARVEILEAGGEIVELTPEERQMFIDAVTPIYAELHGQYSPKLRELVGIN
jgi:TRAP-type C4-dicarboxylate transport system substrate-binding protein